MKFLVPVGGVTDPAFGVLTSPQTYGIPAGIKAGLAWAGDPGCISGPLFVKRYNTQKSSSWLEMMMPYRSTCLFIAVPDHFGNARETLQEFNRHQFRDYPVAFVAQDGMEDLDFPPAESWHALFVGGSTEWKISDAATTVIRRARALNKHIHIGRVNWWKRYKHFRSMEGAERFTCDGTRTRFDGVEKALTAWKGYMDHPCWSGGGVPVSNSAG